MPVDLRRRAALLALAAVPLVPAIARAQRALPEVEVYKSPTCGCCKDWIKHLQAAGFSVKANDVPDSRFMRARFGMPAKFASCHTALVGGYVVEGHVPAREIKRLLAERPNALGVAVPGMPVGAPGMDSPEYRGVVDPYDVLLVQPDGRATVFASYDGKR
ncbi:MAG: DUF411 domain-containing protein [Pseudomonadota bacterium]